MAVSLRDWALSYAKRNLRVFPCRVDKRPVGHLVPRGCLDATTDAGTIRRWWSTGNYSIGCTTGDGLMVVDIDVDKDGEASVRALEGKFGALPASVEQITGGGGRHVFYRYNAKNRDVRKSAGKLGKGIDVRGTNGYAILPPSPHESGGTYRWSVDCATSFAQAPEWLLNLIEAPRVSASVVEISTDRAWLNVIRDGLDEGGRNDGLTRLVGYWMQRIGDPEEVLAMALLFNEGRCYPPLDQEEVEAIVESIAARELAKRTAL
jgi:hypothetical protein